MALGRWRWARSGVQGQPWLLSKAQRSKKQNQKATVVLTISQGICRSSVENIIQTEGTGPKLMFYNVSCNAGDVAQLAQWPPGVHRAMSSMPSAAYGWVWWHTPTSGDRSKAQGHPQLLSKLEPSLGPKKPYLKENKVTSIPKCRPPFSLNGGNGSLYLNVGTGLNKR